MEPCNGALSGGGGGGGGGGEGWVRNEHVEKKNRFLT